jgi:hypothetical protein
MIGISILAATNHIANWPALCLTARAVYASVLPGDQQNTAEAAGCAPVLQVMYDANMHVLLPRINCPALLVVGEKDFRCGSHSTGVSQYHCVWHVVQLPFQQCYLLYWCTPCGVHVDLAMPWMWLILTVLFHVSFLLCQVA